ncbi:ACT domain-containing protein, partial [Pigmentiphaga sp.]
ITHVSMQDEASSTVAVHFTIQVESRQHLARVIRYLRRVPHVQRIIRVKG